MNRAEFKAACQLHLIILNWRNIGSSKESRRTPKIPVLGKRCAKWYLLLSNNNPTFLEQWTNGGIFKEKTFENAGSAYIISAPRVHGQNNKQLKFVKPMLTRI